MKKEVIIKLFFYKWIILDLIKIIYKNKDENEIILMFNEIAKEIKKIELKKKIDSLEDKVSLNLDENLYTELLSLRNQLKGG